MTPSRRHLFALLGLVLPVAAFTAAPVSAATSSAVHHKSHSHHAASSHKAKPHHTSTHNTSHHTTHHTPKAYRELTYGLPARVRFQQRAQSRQNSLRRRRAAADQQIDGKGRAYAAGDGVAALEDAAIDRAVPHRHHEFRLRHCRPWACSTASTRLRVSGPVTRSTSAWRGLATKDRPKRSRSWKTFVSGAQFDARSRRSFPNRCA